MSNKENNQNIVNVMSADNLDSSASSSGDSSNVDIELNNEALTEQFLGEIRDYLNIRQENINALIQCCNALLFISADIESRVSSTDRREPPQVLRSNIEASVFSIDSNVGQNVYGFISKYFI